MSKSPLSGAFAGSSATTKKKNKKNGAILLISGIALATSIGGVFAANSITLNTNNALQFGQGAATASSCDTAMDTSITQQLSSASTAFVVRTVELSGISATCYDFDLVVGIYPANSSTPTTSTTFRPTTGTYSWNVSGGNFDAGNVNRIAVTTEN